VQTVLFRGEVYQPAFDSAMKIYRLTKGFPIEERYSFVDQIKRSSRSMCANQSTVFVIVLMDQSKCRMPVIPIYERSG
jgi:hypothetical protein